MNTYTVIAYVVPEGGHHIETIEAADATAAAIQLREKHGFKLREFEVVAVAKGRLEFEVVDDKQLALAPYSITSP
jgi:hypothetical protein